MDLLGFQKTIAFNSLDSLEVLVKMLFLKERHLVSQLLQFKKAFLIKKEIFHLGIQIYLTQEGGDQQLQEKHLSLNQKVNGENRLLY